MSKTKQLFWEKIALAALPKSVWHLQSLAENAKEPLPNPDKEALEDAFAKKRREPKTAASQPKQKEKLKACGSAAPSPQDEGHHKHFRHLF